ncbi:MAG: TonB-dependent receptor plug domain-containing protein, partial [Bacteroidales bacterium]|nr:TonB-dependent receptor plug domain-containing protein [Bacteroidales bacterium]
MDIRIIIAVPLLLAGAYSYAQEPEKADTLAAATVTSAIDRSINFTQTGLTKIDGSAFRRGFAVFSSPDVLKTLQTLTGVASGTEMLSNLYVHGGDGSDNLFLLDGVPLYQICHLGGIFSSFNTDVVEGIDFYKSGFPARYGGRTSSVVDIATKDGDFKEYNGTVGTGLLDGRLQFEGPIIRDRTSFNVAMRRSWIDVISAPACAIINSMNKEYGEKQYFGYSFTDLNARITHILKPSSRLTANLYWGNDGLRINQEFEGHDQDGRLSDLDITDTRFSWGNLLGSLKWQKDFSDRLDMRLLGFYSGSRSDIRMNTTLEYYRADYT